MDRLKQFVDVSGLDPEMKIDDHNIMDIAYALLNDLPIPEMFPNAKAHEERIRQEKDLLTSTVEEGINICRKCGSRRVTQEIRQMRSGDEAYNAVFHCQDCGNTRIG